MFTNNFMLINTTDYSFGVEYIYNFKFDWQ